MPFGIKKPLHISQGRMRSLLNRLFLFMRQHCYELFEIDNKLHANYGQLLCLGRLKYIDKSSIAVHSSFIENNVCWGGFSRLRRKIFLTLGT